MKYGFKLGNIEAKGIKIGNVEFTVDCSVNETKEMYDLAKTVIKELPETITDLANGAMVFHQVDSEINKALKAEEAKEKAVTAVQKAFTDFLKSSI